MNVQNSEGLHACEGPRLVASTGCCIVGGGPAGIMLGYLLARHGVQVTVLEQHSSLDRDFRGDTLHSSVLTVLDELGLIDDVLALPHTKIGKAAFSGDQTKLDVDFSTIRAKFPFIMMLPQVVFLDFMVDRAKELETFTIEFGATVTELLQCDEGVSGVRYRARGMEFDLTAPLVVGADGRSSRLRRLAGLEAKRLSPPMDVLWFRLPRKEQDTDVWSAVARGPTILASLNRGDQWQIAYVLPKGAYSRLREAGLSSLRRSISEVRPDFSDRLEALNDWGQIRLLSVEADRCRRWYRPGLLLIGDAAHVMSPVGGVGINMAIHDAVVAANVLTPRLLLGWVRSSDLAAVQRRRELPTKIIQAIQNYLQKEVISRTFEGKGLSSSSCLLRWPQARQVGAWLIAHGGWPVHVKPRWRKG